ncbi:MAG: hypothetical protein JWO20_1654 [Candidatus Angelobacter sp.]|jgi:uncharacterized protein Yka (UPF0111/DUF47 family)|nr:hypothetical protein [Candidatus Angelobacter sp.]
MDLRHVFENEIRDFGRVIRADEALLERENDPDKRAALLKEIGEMEDKIDRVQRKIRAWDV